MSCGCVIIMLEQQPLNNSENGKIEKGNPRNETSREEKRHRVRYCAGKTRPDHCHGAKDDAGTAKAADRGIGKAGAEPLLMGRFCYFVGAQHFVDVNKMVCGDIISLKFVFSLYVFFCLGFLFGLPNTKKDERDHHH